MNNIAGIPYVAAHFDKDGFQTPETAACKGRFGKIFGHNIHQIGVVGDACHIGALPGALRKTRRNQNRCKSHHGDRYGQKAQAFHHCAYPLQII